jgi:predicted ATPase
MAVLADSIVGRDKERYRLEYIYKECMNCSQVVWISGASGVGKSALIQHFLHDKKNVCCGKFDFIKSSIPYSTIIKILHELSFLLEVENSNLRLGPEVTSVLSKLLPQIHNVTTQLEIEGGLDRIIESKNSEWGFQQLKQAIRVFTEVAVDAISSSTNLPVIFHIDDLQWADDASLEIIKALFDGNDVMNQLIFIISYREDEVDDDGAIGLCKDLIIQSNYMCSEISLGNLTYDNVISLVSSRTNLRYEQAKYLGGLIYDVTRGNSLFVRRYLNQVIKQRLIRKCQCSDDWEIDDSKIGARVMEGEDIVSFIAQEINNLPSPVSELLKVSSLLGQEVEIALLKSVLLGLDFDLSKFSFSDILECLESKCLITIKTDKKTFHFVHDRIYQAAYNLSIQGNDLEKLSLRIGRILLNIEDEFQSQSSLFQLLLAVDQMNRGSSLVHTIDGKEELAELNLKAAKEVLKVNAFKLAQSYLEKSLEILGEKCWEIHYHLTLRISNLMASVLLGNGLMDQSMHLIDHICMNCTNSDDSREAQIVKLEILACTNQLDRCLEMSQGMLSELRICAIPSNPGLRDIIIAMAKVQRLLRPLSSENILDLPICKDCKIQHAMKICKETCATLITRLGIEFLTLSCYIHGYPK